ncbi:Hsp90 co-chaperone CDC37 [Sistotremastrum niveocremeum HHB9708]|uniref:Hsp90 chaperone protein kinase-targeting subunit n=1 Tax=Sistotremastrum niveocremeum HHB9708 TaxID=1314777 RepID=A0A164RB96_9AGAM|nr:Hsp90 co-chaperone CDC37 [Sistotremastrum niveocremeum HHB9708]
MPLNYSKWDQLELSDDSDIEGHPNVDKNMLIRLKREAIHQERDKRKQNIARIRAELTTHEVLRPRLATFRQDILQKGVPYFNQIVERLQRNPSPQKPTDAEGQPTYDAMTVDVLMQVHEEVKKMQVAHDDRKLPELLADRIQEHLKLMDQFKVRREKELESELKEQAKHITSDDLKDGWDSHHISPASEPTLAKPKASKEPAKKQTTTEYEVLNPSSIPKIDPTTQYDDGDDLPELTPELAGFAKIPIRQYQQSYEYLQKHNAIVAPGAYDALFVEAWSAQSRGETKYAKQCIHQALLLQYCEKLGVNGIGPFFKKMIERIQPAEQGFLKDVQDTYAHVVKRVEEIKTEPTTTDKETIQLVPESDAADIAWFIPEGPPPENLVLEGPGTEDLDVEEVREVLQTQWNIYQSLSTPVQEALQAHSLDQLNEAMSDMSVEEAEALVEKLQSSAMLRFSAPGVQSASKPEDHLEGSSLNDSGEPVGNTTED